MIALFRPLAAPEANDTNKDPASRPNPAEVPVLEAGADRATTACRSDTAEVPDPPKEAA